MLNQVSEFITKYNLDNETIIIGFSGGPDSLCLTDILIKLKEKHNLTLIAAHYNHNWRGEIALEEQNNCENFCKKNNIKFYTETAPIDTKKNETEAREKRYAFFERVCEKYNTNIVFTGHNYNDNAETILYRIIKGTGLTGLRGIAEVRDNYYRPLLHIERKNIEKYCNDNNLTPNIDNSNFDTAHKRNLIRYDILPLLEKINPQILTSLNRLSEITNTELNILDNYINKIKQDIFKNDKIKLEKYKNLSKELKQKIIYELIYESEVDYNLTLIKNIIEFIEDCINEKKKSKFSLTKNIWLKIDDDYIEIIKKEDKNNNIIEIKQNDIYPFGNKVFSIEKFEKEYYNTDSEEKVLVNLNSFDKLYIRTRRDGDIIQPLGSNGRMKLKKYLMSKKIPQHKRDNLVLLCNKDEVLWVAGIGLSDKIKVVDKPTHILEIKEL